SPARCRPAFCWSATTRPLSGSCRGRWCWPRSTGPRGSRRKFWQGRNNGNIWAPCGVVAVMRKDLRMRTLVLLVVLMMLAGTAGAQTTRPADESARTPHTPLRDGEVRQLLIRELGNFPYDPEAGGGIPEDVKRLSGSKVRLVGYMMP